METETSGSSNWPRINQIVGNTAGFEPDSWVTTTILLTRLWRSMARLLGHKGIDF